LKLVKEDHQGSSSVFYTLIWALQNLPARVSAHAPQFNCLRVTISYQIWVTYRQSTSRVGRSVGSVLLSFYFFRFQSLDWTTLMFEWNKTNKRSRETGQNFISSGLQFSVHR
jgi:hypothetical protein